MDRAGRNDPCPCGSGLDPGACCLGGGRAPRDAVMPALLRFAAGAEFETDHAAAQVLFWADCLDGWTGAEIGELLQAHDTIVRYNSWFLFDVDIDGGTTVADRFALRRGWTLNAGERGFLERMRRSHLRLYQVGHVEPGHGLHLFDLWARRTLFVADRGGSEATVRWDLLGARVVPDGRGTPRFEGGLYRYPVSAKQRLVRQLKARYRSCARAVRDRSDAAFFKRHGMIFNHWWIDLVVAPVPPQVGAPEGEGLVFARVWFDLRDASAFRSLLAGRDDVQVQEDGTFVWVERVNGGTRSLATFAIDGPSVVGEALSRRRGERLRRWMERLAGDAVAYRGTSLEALSAALDRRARTAGGGVSPGGAPQGLTVGAPLAYPHHREWLDQPIPALRHRSPRAAARSRALRPLLVDLLREMENHADHAARQGEPAFDGRWLWEELGLSPDVALK